MSIVAKYMGVNPLQEYHVGIPARDLTEEDFAALDGTEQEIVRASSKYKMVEKVAEVEESTDTEAAKESR